MTEFTRVRDTKTGHEFDLPTGAVEAYGDAVEVIEGDAHGGHMATARPPKYSTDSDTTEQSQMTTQVSKPAAPKRAVSGVTSEESAR